MGGSYPSVSVVLAGVFQKQKERLEVLKAFGAHIRCVILPNSFVDAHRVRLAVKGDLVHLDVSDVSTWNICGDCCDQNPDHLYPPMLELKISKLLKILHHIDRISGSNSRLSFSDC